MKLNFRVVIPARYASTRLPGKPLLPIAGRPMLQHVYDCAQQSGAREVIIATDDQRIADAAARFDAPVCLTLKTHNSGTERLAEVAAKRQWDDDDIIVNVQGDEPMMPAALIRQVAADLADHETAPVATLACPIQTVTDAADTNVVKVVLDKQGFALYFSRASIPCRGEGSAAVDDAASALRHIGLYAYRAGFLQRYVGLTASPLEAAEKLEQLRVLWHGIKIHVGIAAELPGPGVDTEADLVRVNRLMSTSEKID